jgi:hypothetical protein
MSGFGRISTEVKTVPSPRRKAADSGAREQSMLRGRGSRSARGSGALGIRLHLRCNRETWELIMWTFPGCKVGRQVFPPDIPKPDGKKNIRAAPVRIGPHRFRVSASGATGEACGTSVRKTERRGRALAGEGATWNVLRPSTRFCRQTKGSRAD